MVFASTKTPKNILKIRKNMVETIWITKEVFCLLFSNLLMVLEFVPGTGKTEQLLILTQKIN
jgi:hypothetical protein